MITVLLIFSALQKIEDESFDPDVEGFNIVFKKDSKNGYAVVDTAFEPNETIVQLMKKSAKFKEVISLEKEALPDMNPFIEKAITSSFNFCYFSIRSYVFQSKEKK